MRVMSSRCDGCWARLCPSLRGPPSVFGHEVGDTTDPHHSGLATMLSCISSPSRANATNAPAAPSRRAPRRPYRVPWSCCQPALLGSVAARTPVSLTRATGLNKHAVAVRGERESVPAQDRPEAHSASRSYSARSRAARRARPCVWGCVRLQRTARRKHTVQLATRAQRPHHVVADECSCW